MVKVPDLRLMGYMKPFAYTGFDCFGPMFVAIGRRREKRWEVLVTGLNSRAIQLELASSLSIDVANFTIQRFEGRKDYRTNFRGADVELQKVLSELNEDYINQEFSSYLFIGMT
jgi:hypothetical protein